MKRIFAIILAVLMMFSISTTAFAGFTMAPVANKAEPETVGVLVTLDKDYTPVNKLEIFESYSNPYAEKAEDKEVVIKGRIFKINFTIINGTKEIIYANEVLKGFSLSITDAMTEKVVQRWTKAKDCGFGDIDLNKIAINPGEKTVVTYKIYAITDKTVTIKAAYEEKVIDIEKEDASFTLIVAPKTETTTVTTTTVTTTEKAETSKPTVSTTTNTTKITTTYTENMEENNDYDYDYEEIPNTGSAPIIGTVAALGLAAGAIILLKKKKIDD